MCRACGSLGHAQRDKLNVLAVQASCDFPFLGGGSGVCGGLHRRCARDGSHGLGHPRGLHLLSFVQVGDGDCGSTLAKGAAGVKAALDRLPADDLAATALALAHIREF